jgi:hypothetical protein
MPTDAVTENPQKYLVAKLTQPVGMASKNTKVAEKIYSPLVMVSIGAW